MITLQVNVNYLNVSLQVGDTIYARSTDTQDGAEDAQQDTNGQYSPTNELNIVGILRKISQSSQGFILSVEDTLSSYTVQDNDFIMFSKHDQSRGDVIGYYAQAKFVNNSRKKAEIFSVGSEIIINSK